MKLNTSHRRGLAAIAFAAALATAGPSFADDAAPAPVPAEVTPDAAPIDVPSGPVIVDTEAGTVTPAPGTPADRISKDPVGVVQEAIAAVKAGNWRLVLSLVLGAIMVLGIRFGGRVFPQTTRGKAAMVGVLAVVGTVSAALGTDVSITGSLFLGTLGVVWAAVGAREWIAALLWPKDGKQYLIWLKPLLGKT